MDKLELIKRNTEEIINEDKLSELLKKKNQRPNIKIYLKAGDQDNKQIKDKDEMKKKSAEWIRKEAQEIAKLVAKLRKQPDFDRKMDNYLKAVS